MENLIGLDSLQPGECGIVCKIKSCGDIQRRFLDIGLIENTKVKCVGCSPSGDPSAYLIRGAVIAIRSDDSKNILIKPITAG